MLCILCTRLQIPLAGRQSVHDHEMRAGIDKSRVAFAVIQSTILMISYT